MDARRGFWANFKAAFGFGLGGGLGAGFGWKVGQWLGDLFIKLARWIGLLAIGAAATLYQTYSKTPEEKAQAKAEAAQRLEKAPPEMRAAILKWKREQAAEAKRKAEEEAAGK